MFLRFAVLGSGSAGNASLLQAGPFGVLIDAGLGPRLLAGRLAEIGASWHSIHAVLLTHTHSDHWSQRALAHFHRRGIPFYCHGRHRDELSAKSPAFADLEADGLVRTYDSDQDLSLPSGLRCRPLALAHDGGATFGFRFEHAAGLFGEPNSLAYAADLGCWNDRLADALADVDLLALEFNHDVDLERGSGRSPDLIARVLGDRGHLSNDQAAELLRAVLRRSCPGRLRHVVQLHLSRDCNRPTLARQAARAVLADNSRVAIHTARQHRCGPCLILDPRHAGSRRALGDRVRAPRRPLAEPLCQPMLPGW